MDKHKESKGNNTYNDKDTATHTRTWKASSNWKNSIIMA